MIVMLGAILPDPPEVAFLVGKEEGLVVGPAQPHSPLAVFSRSLVRADVFHHLRDAEEGLVSLSVDQRVFPAGTNRVVAGVAKLIAAVAVTESLDEPVVVEIAGDEIADRLDERVFVRGDEGLVAGGEVVVGGGVEHAGVGVRRDVALLKNIVERAIVVHSLVQPELDGLAGDLVQVDAHEDRLVAHAIEPL